MFDRGVTDCVAYAAILGVDPTPSLIRAQTVRYTDEVLLFEPWEDIYTTDDERTMSFADVIGFHQEIVSAFDRAGYVLVPVPRGSVEERRAFVNGSMSHARRGR